MVKDERPRSNRERAPKERSPQDPANSDRVGPPQLGGVDRGLIESLLEKETAPIQPPLRRTKRVPSPIDGTPIFKTEPLTDFQLRWIAHRLTWEEKLRLDRFWKEEFENPLMPAVRAIEEIQSRPKILMQRRGPHAGKLGKDPVEIEIVHAHARRLAVLAIRAIRAIHRSPSKFPRPLRDHSGWIADQIVAGCREQLLIRKGPLKDWICKGQDDTPERRTAYLLAVNLALRDKRRGARSMARGIVGAILVQEGYEAVDEDYLRNFIL